MKVRFAPGPTGSLHIGTALARAILDPLPRGETLRRIDAAL
jgi:valyl-tRNA synthetase